MTHRFSAHFHAAASTLLALVVAAAPRPASASTWEFTVDLEAPSAIGLDGLHVVDADDLKLQPVPLLPEGGAFDHRPMAVEQTSRPKPTAPALTAAVEVLATSMVIATWNRTVGSARWANVTPQSVRANLSSAWVLDDNAYFVNQMGHPLQGSVSFGAARSAGLGFWASTAYPFAASALWELAGETERPALNDQVTTTVGGIVLGEVLYRTADWIRGDGRSVWRQAAATLLSPMSTVNRTIVVGGEPEPPAPLRLSAGMGVITTDPSPSIDGGMAPSFDLRLTNGVPGAPWWSFRRPFDHFDVAFLLAPAPDPVITLRARGLALGSPFAEGPSGGGLWGMWLSFDLASPGNRRVSTSAVGVGATGRCALSPAWTLDGTAVASAVILGASGVTTPVGDRSYRFGPGAQGVLEGSMTWEDRFRLGLNLRPYLVVATGAPQGADALAVGELSARYRIWGHHAIETTATQYLRRTIEGDGRITHADGTTLMVTWRWTVEPLGAGVQAG